MAASSTATKTPLSPVQMVLVLGAITAITIYMSLLVLLLLLCYVLHWTDPVTAGILIDLIPGSLLIALLNMLLCSLYVALPRHPHEGHAIIAGVICGLLAPSIISIAAIFSSILRLGYFLNYSGAPSTSLVELMGWPLTTAPFILTIMLGWFTILVCCWLDILFFHRIARAKRQNPSNLIG